LRRGTVTPSAKRRSTVDGAIDPMPPCAVDAGRETMATRHFVNNLRASNPLTTTISAFLLGFSKILERDGCRSGNIVDNVVINARNALLQETFVFSTQ
jgi:hypothetical protein